MLNAELRAAHDVLQRYVDDLERCKERRPGESPEERLLRSMDHCPDENQEYWEEVAGGAADTLAWALGQPGTATGQLMAKLCGHAPLLAAGSPGSRQ